MRESMLHVIKESPIEPKIAEVMRMSLLQRLPIRAVQARITVRCLSERSLTLLSWKYSTSTWMKLDGQSDGISWCMCADDGATSFLHHCVACVCNFVAQERRL
jgi:hypothetical protein